MRFISVVWNRENPKQRSSAKFLMQRLLERSPEDEWQRSLNHDGCVVFSAGQATKSLGCLPLDRGSGVIFGALFKRSPIFTDPGIASRAEIGPRESEKIIASGGRELVSNYWGNYVTFLAEAAAGRTWVLRGPLSALVPRLVMYEDVAVYFSDLDDIFRLGLFSFSFNFKKIAAFMVADNGNEQTALNEITEPLQGQCTEWYRGKNSKHQYWHPLDFTTKEREIASIDEAIVSLRSTVTSCTQTWATCYNDILLALSGGVDSSIILAALEGTATHIRCFTHYSDARGEDERPLARAAAHKFNRQLFEIQRPFNLKYEDALQFKPTINPPNYLTLLLTLAKDFIPASARSSDAVFSGDGGDEYFFRHLRHFCFLDLVYRTGFFNGAIQEATRAAIKDGHRVWRILGGAWYDAWIPHQISFTKQAFAYKRLMKDEVLQELVSSRACESIWFRSTSDAPPGKLYHIHLLMRRMGGGSAINSAWKPYACDPLKSQPLTELALRIPTHYWWLNGRERGLALKAFENGLTHETLTRRWKGGVTSNLIDLFRGNASFIQQLLEGCPLIGAEILDREKIQQSMSDVLHGKAAHASEILGATDLALFMELWNKSGHLRRPPSFSHGYSRPKLAESEIQ